MNLLCPNCQKMLTVPEQYAGQLMKCPLCSTNFTVPALPAGARSAYRKVRDRASYAFALVSVAAVLEVADGRVRDVRIALGGAAHKPWRASRAEEVLRGTPPTPPLSW